MFSILVNPDFCQGIALGLKEDDAVETPYASMLIQSELDMTRTMFAVIPLAWLYCTYGAGAFYYLVRLSKKKIGYR
jgi:hypothetical protein